MRTRSPATALVVSMVLFVSLIACGAGHGTVSTPTGGHRSASVLPPFGSDGDLERAQALAGLTIRAMSKRRHPRERFLVATEAYTNTRTLFFDTAQGRLTGPGASRSTNFKREVKVVLRLEPDQKLRVVTYRERAIDVAPVHEQP